MISVPPSLTLSLLAHANGTQRNVSAVELHVCGRCNSMRDVAVPTELPGFGFGGSGSEYDGALVERTQDSQAMS